MTHHLAYCSANSDVAEALIGKLSREHLSFNRITPDPSPLTFGQFAENLMYQQDPVVLLLTDNLLKDEACMVGLYPSIQSLLSRDLLLVITADGRDEAGNPVPTEYDRVVHAMNYMNFWQGKYLNLVETMQQTEGESERQAMYKHMEAASAIPGQIGDLLTLLMNAGSQTMEWRTLAEGGFEAYFQYFGLSDLFGAPPVQPEPAPSVADMTVQPPPADPILPTFSVQQPIAPVRLPFDRDLLPLEDAQEDGLSMEAPAEPLETDTSLMEDAQEDGLSMEALTPDPEETEDRPFFVEPVPEAVADSLEEARAILGQVHEALEYKSAEAALSICQDAVDRFPEDKDMRLGLLRAYLRLGDTDNAMVQRTILQDIGLPEGDRFEIMGDIREAQDLPEEAEYFWLQAVRSAPDRSGPIQIKIDRLRALQIDAPEERVETGSESPEPPQPEALSEALLPEHETAPDNPVTDPEPKAPVQALPERRAQAALTVFITGATSGIGRATAERFAREGHRLILTGRRADRLEQLKRELEDNTTAGAIHTIILDVRNRADVFHAVENLPESWKEIDVLINNAGLAKGLDPIHEGSMDHWDTMIDTNIKGLLYVTRAITPGMVHRKRGHIVNIGSSAGKEVYPKGNVYCATKFAVDALSQGMRMDLHAHNIRVSQVSPGHVEDTEFALTRFDGDAVRARIYEDFQPLKATDVANAIYFMVEQPDWVNIQDMWMFSTQQAASTIINRSGR